MTFLPTEIINKIMLYNISDEAKLIKDEINKGQGNIKPNKKTFKKNYRFNAHFLRNRPLLFGMFNFKEIYPWDVDDYKGLTIVRDCCCESEICGEYKHYFKLTNKDGSFVSVNDIKKLCIQNGLTKKTQKNKLSWLNYLIKNI